MPIFGPKCQFWAKFGRFWAQNPIFWGQGVKILVPSYQDSNETPFSCWKHWSVRLQLAHQKVFPLLTVGAPSARRPGLDKNSVHAFSSPPMIYYLPHSGHNRRGPANRLHRSHLSAPSNNQAHRSRGIQISRGLNISRQRLLHDERPRFLWQASRVQSR